MVLSILLCSFATFTSYAANDNQNESESEIEELQPVTASGCLNDYNHIFGKPEHNLSGFLDYYGGNQANAYNAVYNVAQSYVTTNGISGIINANNQITIDVSGYNITFRGNVIGGTLHIGTFFIQ